MGIVLGTGDNKFNPLEPISRQDIIVIINRTLEITGKNSKLTTDNSIKISNYNDNGEVASYAKESVDQLIREGIVTGDGKNINPNNFKKEQKKLQFFIKY